MYDPRMRTAWLCLASIAALASCHLADSPEPGDCPAGTHRNGPQCATDAYTGPVIAISSAASGSPCGVTPETVTVKPNADFAFKNDDQVDHIVSGKDGTLWVTAKAGQLSALIGITRVGTWPYEVTGCPKGGVIVVE